MKIEFERPKFLGVEEVNCYVGSRLKGKRWVLLSCSNDKIVVFVEESDEQ